MAQWIRPLTVNREVPGSNQVTAAVVPLGKVVLVYPDCLVSQKGLKAIVPPVACLYKKLAFLVARLKKKKKKKKNPFIQSFFPM